MKLDKQLYINGEIASLADHTVSLKLSMGSMAVFTISDDISPEKYQAVRFDIGYQNNIKEYFEGYIDKVQPAQNGYYKITCKENVGILGNRWPVSIEHPTMIDILDALSDKTGLEFVLPEGADYSNEKIPNFVCQGTGYQCLQQIGRAYNVDDFIWFQHTDQTVYVGSFEDSRFFNNPITLPLDLSLRLKGDNITLPVFPMVRPGVLISTEIFESKRVVRVDLFGDEMTAYFAQEKNSVPVKKREILNYFPELATLNHLPKLARIEAVRDCVDAGQTADPFRSRFAVDVQLLDENLDVDSNVPVYRSIPMPFISAGAESGSLSYPLEGTIVEVAFAYGRNDLPMIRGVYGRDHGLPNISPGEQVHQQRDEVSQRTEANGNTCEKTDQTQTKQSFLKNDQADRMKAEYGQHYLVVDEHSVEEIVGKKVLEALGAIELLAGDDLTLGTLSNMQQAVAGEFITTIGKLRNTVIKLDDKLKVMGEKVDTIEKDWAITAKNITQDATTIKLNGGAGVCTGESICPFTGSPHVDISTTVYAGK